MSSTLIYILQANRDQFFSDKSFTFDVQELILKWAIFIDGINALSTMSVNTKPDVLTEEYSWLLAEDSNWPFSFLNLCKTFNIDRLSLRDNLIKAIGEQMKENL